MNSNLKIKDVISYLNHIAPLSFQESYDNSGLIFGDQNELVTSILITLDITEDIIDEAKIRGSNLIISHHPLIFSGIKKITGQNHIEKTLIKAIQNNIALYSSHTNLDSVYEGVNLKICQKLGLTNCKILQPSKDVLKKLVTFIPTDSLEKVSNAIFEAGAGHIGNYSSCSYSTKGTGSFRGNENTNPYKGEKNKIHFEPEFKFETIFPKHLQSDVINALIKTHPYEEVAYDVYSLDNTYDKSGMGMAGILKKPIGEIEFLKRIKSIFNCKIIKHTNLLGKPVTKVAVCGGSGSFLLEKAIAVNADLFISADFKYHQFFDHNSKIVIVDIGHFESEQFTKELIYELLIKKFPKFAIHLSKVRTNPINYF